MPRAPVVAQPRGDADDDPSHRFVKGPTGFPQDHLAPFRANGRRLILAGDHPLWLELDYEVRAARRERLDHRCEHTNTHITRRHVSD